MFSTISENNKVIPLSHKTYHGTNNSIDYNNQKLILELTTKHNTNKPLVEWCKLFISLSPNTLQNILDTIRDIIIDDEIDLVDIPNMILLIISNVQMEAMRYDIVSSEHMVNFTKIISHMIIDYELFGTSPYLQNNIVVEAMINSCLELIQIDLKMLKKPVVVVEPKKEETSDFWKWVSSFICFWW